MKNNEMNLARCLLFLCLLCIPALSNAAISVIDGFDPNANGPVKAMA